jgi:DNA-binding transcriptional regulator of glucitol operon
MDGPMGLVVKRPMSEEEYTEFMVARGWKYDVKAETCKYLSDDVKCLSQVMECFRSGWQEMPYQPELFQYCTIGQMCHTYFLDRFLEPRTYPTLDVVEDAFIRRALFGGRTEVFQRCVPTPERIHYVDVNSLYPFVMESRNLPSGDPIWHFCSGDDRIPLFRASDFKLQVMTHASLDGVKDRLNACDASLYGFFEVDVQCPQDMHYPILPERANDKNMFTNCFKVKMVYYSEELKFAIQRGCKVVHVHAWSEWLPRKVYSRCIQVLKAEKMRGEGKDVQGNPIPGAVKNPSLRAAAKTAQNALYGKSIQYINESVQIVDNHEDLFRLARTAESDVTVQPIYRSGDLDIVEVVVKPHKPRVQPRSCSAVGTAILAEARMVLYTYFEEVMRVGGTILYCDTDSIVFAGDQPLPDSCLSDAEYGKMKVEIPPDDIVPGGFVALAPKCYSFLLKDGSPYVKCKGIHLASNVSVGAETGLDELLELFEAEDVLQELVGAAEADDCLSGLSFEHLRMMVLGEKRKIVTKQMQFLKTRDRHVACIDTVKLLKDDFDKRWILDGGVTVPWSDINRHIIASIEQRDITYVSNFFQSASVYELEFVEHKFGDSPWFKALWNSWLDSGDFNAEYYKSLKNI